MQIDIRQSELNRNGFAGIDFPNLPWADRRNVAARVCTARGDQANAMLLEINNPIACNSIRYIQDVPRK